MMQQTSLQAYHKYKDTSLNKQEMAVVAILKAFPLGLTIAEIDYLTTFKINAVCGRIGDLRKKGLISENGTRINELTNVSNKVWVLI